MDIILQVLLAVVFGFISFISPCVLPLVPAYLSYISGVSLEEMQNPDRKRKAMLKVLVNSLFFVGGFTIVFVVLGILAQLFGAAVATYQTAIWRFLGIVLIVFGLHMMGVIQVPFMLKEKRFEGQKGSLGVVGSLIIGMAFAFGWTPCVGPFLAATLALAADSKTIFKAVFLLLVYSAGLGVPFILSGLAINAFFSAFSRIKKLFRVIELVGGGLLTLMGFLFVYDKIGWLSTKLGALAELSFAVELWFDSLVKGETALGAAGIWVAGLIALLILAVFALIVVLLFRRGKAKRAEEAAE
ncbi:MAG: cytochrome c biogenesis protein CcdA [Candidatus Coatesbacteria bacterium]|nr:MAG: cytochrome c biogenesis protein CcdA [Candidatus Coatesbacteria bacterium]